jgi:hypothetical protein
MLDRAELRLRAGREALDPSTHTWVKKSRLDRPVPDPKGIRHELLERIDQARGSG